LPDLTVYQSFDGFDAGAQLVDKKPGFVILDIALPGVNGQEICKRIKNDPAFGKPYIIVITALEDPDLEKNLYELGADRFFRKPLALQDILETINTAVETN
jgi:two-component system, OmpR family, response regulator